MSLQRVSFRKGREHRPRLSAPYVPGKHHQRFWTAAEDEVLRKYYPSGGLAACAAHLPPHRQSASAIYVRANKLGLKSGRMVRTRVRVEAPADIDDILRYEYEQQDGKKRGAINAIADKLGLPRWWVTKRAIRLGLTMPHKKEPPWTAAETALMRQVPLHDPDKCARIFREHGFARSPTAIMVRAKRINLSRRFNEGLSATAAAKILGVDAKTFSSWCVAGEVNATRRADKRLPQQGGSRWIVEPADLRQFVIENLGRIDLRKVDKFELVRLLITGGPVNCGRRGA